VSVNIITFCLKLYRHNRHSIWKPSFVLEVPGRVSYSNDRNSTGLPMGVKLCSFHSLILQWYIWTCLTCYIIWTLSILVDFKGFWRWYMTFRTTGFLDFVHCPVFPQVSPAPSPEDRNKSSFWNVVFICFLDYRTMNKVQKSSSCESSVYCYALHPASMNTILNKHGCHYIIYIVYNKWLYLCHDVETCID
jgi:hypothetical protein